MANPTALTTDEALLEGLRRRDPAAERALVTVYGDRVFNTALGLLQNRNDAADVAQEVFAQAFQGLPQFRGEARLSTWLYRITVSRCREVQRAAGRKKRFGLLQSLFKADSLHLTVDVAHFQHPGVLLENQEQAAVLFAAIQKLPEKQQTAFVLHKLEEVSQREIAAVLGTSLAAVESLLFRAKQQLQKLLEDYYEQHYR